MNEVTTINRTQREYSAAVKKALARKPQLYINGEWVDSSGGATIDETLAIIDACRRFGMRSVNVDLIYGLPKQTPAGFGRTLDTVVAMRPDRLAVYSYAHLPNLFKAQRQIEEAERLFDTEGWKAYDKQLARVKRGDADLESANQRKRAPRNP